MFKLHLTENTHLALLQEHHSDEVFKTVDHNRSHLRKWLPWVDGTKSSADTKEFIKSQLELFAKNSVLVSGIWVQDRYAGTIGFHKIDWTNKRASIGYWLAEEFQGKGIMGRACRTFTDHAFKELRLNKVEIHCATENKRSRAIPERLGFKHEGSIRQAEWLYDYFVDHEVYGMLAKEWS